MPERTFPIHLFSVRLLRLSFTAIFLLFTSVLFAQDWKYQISGTAVKGGKPLEGAVVTLSKDGAKVGEIITTKKGKFDFTLDPDHVYVLSVGKPGHITKKITFDTRNVPIERGNAGFGKFIITEIGLFDLPANLQTSQIDECISKPVAIVKYDDRMKDFNYDREYTKQSQDCLEKIKKLQKQIEDKMQHDADSMKNVIDHNTVIEGNFNMYKTNGDNFFNAQNYKDARTAYLEALKIKPDDAYCKGQVTICDQKIKELNDKLLLEKQYTDLIKQADDQFKLKQYQGARNLYVQAQELKPTEQYPKTQIAECDRLLKEMGDIELRYKTAMANGEKAFSQGMYSIARTSFVEASGIKPQEQLPKDRIAACDKMMKDAEEQKYKDALAKADKLFADAKYVDAKTAYQEASSLKPKEQYPITQIALCDAKIKEMGDKEKQDALYKAAITKADGFFNAKDFVNAKTNYETASGIKPSEQYPKDQIALCDAQIKLLGDKLKLEQQYKDALAKADALFAKQDWVNAKSGYREALTFKAGEPYPTGQIVICEQKIKDLELEQRYKDALKKADDLFNGSDFVNAKTAYQDALTVKPKEQYPKDQIIKCDAKIKELGNKEKQDQLYKDAIAVADGFFGKQDYANAKTNYVKASGIKPTEQYPKDQIVICDAKLKEQKDLADKLKLDQQYKDALALADGFFGKEDYINAKTNYIKASGLKPNEQYPKDQIVLCDAKIKLMGDKQKLDAMYKAALAKADALFTAKNYVDAKTNYQTASGYKPEEQYPKDQIALCDAKIKELGDKEKQDALYKAAIAKADGMFNTKDYVNAKTTYQDALTIKPNEQYPKDQIVKCDAKIKEMGDKEKQDALYKAAIDKADKLFNGSDWVNAKSAYQEALTIKPTEVYPKSQITICDAKIKELGNKEKQDQMYKDALAVADGFFGKQDYANAKTNYVKASGIKPTEQYPKDQIVICDAKLKELKDIADKEKLDQQYKDALAIADGFFGKEDYINAKSNYVKASGIKPGEQYPKDQIVLCDAKIKLMGDKQKLDALYKAALAKADAQFTAKDYAGAKTNYQAASGYKPEEQYPKDQIALCDAKLKEIADKEKQDALYKAAIAKADGMFNAKDYVNAKTTYQDASTIKPKEQYPITQIALCDAKIKEMGDKEKQDALYKAAIDKADKLFNASDWTNAKTAYLEASGIKPTEQYPKSQILLCDKNANASILEQKYNTAIKSGDDNFKTTEYNTAMTFYKEALTYKPTEPYPKTQIAECLRLIKLKELDQKNLKLYQDAIAKADKLFQASDWKNAKVAYGDALRIKDDPYPKDQIRICDEKIQAEINAQVNDQKYKDAIIKADRLRDAKTYDPAIDAYNEALTYKAGDMYAIGEIAKIKALIKSRDSLAALMKDAKYLNDRFVEARDRGDKCFAKKDFYCARDAYKEALTFNPSNIYCKDMLAKCEAEILKMADADKKNKEYQILLTKADNLFTAGKFLDAKNVYIDASAIKPDEKYPKDRIAECEFQLSQIELIKQRDALWLKYNEAMKIADALFYKKDYVKARVKYKEALSYQPGEQPPKDRIAQCDAFIKDKTLITKDTTKVPVVNSDSPTERKKRYEMLKAKYGVGISEEPEVVEQNKKVLKRIVVDDEKKTGDVFLRVTYNYGSTFYYRNDLIITMEEFDQATTPK